MVKSPQLYFTRHGFMHSIFSGLLRSQGRTRHCEDVVRSNPELCTKLNRA
jgi:hypothetical protein